MKDPLKNYYDILERSARAYYLRAKQHRLDYEMGDSDERLWEKHRRAMEDFKNSEGGTAGNRSLLDLKIELAERVLHQCEFCERMCGADRRAGEVGHCGVLEARISSEFLHMGEEPPLVPSYTIFFSGCTLDCVFCQNYDISTNPRSGRRLAPEVLASRIGEKFRGLGSGLGKPKNINWVGGDPTPNLPFILRVFNELEINIPQIWNSNMYLSETSMKLLDGLIDVYLTDFKYGNDKCAERLSGVDNYFEVVSRNHITAAEQAEVIVRHLVMPNHMECCSKPVLDWISENIPQVLVNVMGQYRPRYRADQYSDISYSLSGKEFRSALRYAEKLGLDLTR